MAKNPKVVVDAFLPDILSIGKIVLRPITAGTSLILGKIKCPLVDEDNIAEARRNKGKFTAKLSDDDVARLVFVLTHPSKESRVILFGGLEAFDAAVYDYLDRIQLADLPKLGELMNKHFERAFSTVIGGDPGAEKKTASQTPGTN